MQEFIGILREYWEAPVKWEVAIAMGVVFLVVIALSIRDIIRMNREPPPKDQCLVPPQQERKAFTRSARKPARPLAQ